MATSDPSSRVHLDRYHAYDRLAIRSIFEPSVVGKLGGPWQSGIIQTPKDSGNYAFLVTLGGGRYEDVLYEDGYLRWKSQDQQRLDMPAIRRFISHDPSSQNIRLFIRSADQREYTYLGLLEYVEHDLIQQNPCEFVWRVMHWDLAAADLTRMGLPFAAPLMPVSTTVAPAAQVVRLVRSAPPKRVLAAPKPTVVSSSPPQGKEIDWATRDERNRGLGSRGERIVLQHEVDRLIREGRKDLADRVEHVALVDSRVGFDIRSFETDGQELRIEVKTTEGPKSAAFFISANEVRASTRYPEAFRIYRVFGLSADKAEAGFYVLKGDLSEALDLIPSTYRALPRASAEGD